ncbi:MAG: fused MFS/spermidine synthase [Elusimicrobia bacterium]|nr:fused MFS/spermidine synthase [Elusimicrobiota bacterium]
MMKASSEKAAAPASTTPFLMTSLFATGLCSLVVEIVGTRLISPFYGSSIYTWSALITTTMVALAAGYAWGGRLGDRDPHLVLFARLLLAAGAAVAIIPVLREPVLRASAPLGLKFGALAAAAALVGPTLVLLGMMGPVVTRLTATSALDAGRRSGDAWAVSTLGSVVGAALAGFVLIPLWPGSRILLGAAAALAGLGAWGLWLATRRASAAAIVAAAFLVLSVRAGGGRHGAVLERVESAYGRVEVFDAGERLCLLVNGTNQSEMDKSTGLSAAVYLRALQWTRALRPKARTALVLGLGAGLLPRALERTGLTVDSVEIDPEIVRAARRHFGYAPRGRTFVDDARALLESRDERWDLMVLDAFGSESPPCHLFTVEAFTRMRRSLTPEGVLAVNLVSGVLGPEGRPWRATYKTLARVFPNVRVFVGAQTAPGLFNVLFFAADGHLDAPASSAPADAREAVAAMLPLELTPRPADAAEMSAVAEMTDDYAPLDSLLAATAVRSRRLLQEDMPDILLR